MRALRVDQDDWARGTVSTFEGDDGETWLQWVDDAHIDIYDWSIAPSLPYDLAAIRHPVDVLGFVKRWGLLHDRDDDNAPWPTVEAFMRESLTMNWLLYLYGLLRPGHDEQATRRSLAEYWVGVATGEFGRGTRTWLNDPRRRKTAPDLIDMYEEDADVEQMKIDVREILEEEVRERLLNDVQLSISNLDFFDASSAEDTQPPGEFVLTLWPRNLIGRAYAELAMQMTAGIPVAMCPEDGRVFAVHDPRQIYCSTQCAGRARYRRFSKRKKSEDN
jgi:hypothetical protein